MNAQQDCLCGAALPVHLLVLVGPGKRFEHVCSCRRRYVARDGFFVMEGWEGNPFAADPLTIKERSEYAPPAVDPPGRGVEPASTEWVDGAQRREDQAVAGAAPLDSAGRPRFYLAEICPDGTWFVRDGEQGHAFVGTFHTPRAAELLGLLNRLPHLFDGVAGQVESDVQRGDSVETEVAAAEARERASGPVRAHRGDRFGARGTTKPREDLLALAAEWEAVGPWFEVLSVTKAAELRKLVARVLPEEPALCVACGEALPVDRVLCVGCEEAARWRVRQAGREACAVPRFGERLTEVLAACGGLEGKGPIRFEWFALQTLAAEIDADAERLAAEHVQAYLSERVDLRRRIEEAVARLPITRPPGWVGSVIYTQDLLDAIDEIFGGRPAPPQPADLCQCGHRRDQHVYDVSACRPGVVCSCESFRLPGEVVAPAATEEGDLF